MSTKKTKKKKTAKKAPKKKTKKEKQKKLSTKKEKGLEKLETSQKVIEEKPIIKCHLIEERVITEDSDNARELFNQSSYGKIIENKVQLSLLEALYLLEKKKIKIIDKKNPLTFEKFLKIAKKTEPNFWIRYCVFKDIRNRGYVIKTALKFGADFRIYDRGVKPGEAHARWIVYPVAEGSTLTWHEFAAKNRVAHSTKKRLLIAVVDDESDVTYYEIAWKRP